MSHLSRRYTEHYYVEGAKGKLVKMDVLHTNPPKYLRALQNRSIAAPPFVLPNAVFPCQHEERGFVSAKKSNHTHARYKRRNKARIRARKAK